MPAAIWLTPIRSAPTWRTRSASWPAFRDEGTVGEAFTPVTGHGAISILAGRSLEDVQARIDRLPLVAAGLLTFECTEITELQARERRRTYRPRRDAKPGLMTVLMSARRSSKWANALFMALMVSHSMSAQP